MVAPRGRACACASGRQVLVPGPSSRVATASQRPGASCQRHTAGAEASPCPLAFSSMALSGTSRAICLGATRVLVWRGHGIECREHGFGVRRPWVPPELCPLCHPPGPSLPLCAIQKESGSIMGSLGRLNEMTSKRCPARSPAHCEHSETGTLTSTLGELTVGVANRQLALGQRGGASPSPGPVGERGRGKHGCEGRWPGGCRDLPAQCPS